MQTRYSLRFESGDKKGETVAIPATGLTIGRKEGNGLRIADASVSGNHARLSIDAEGVKITDLGSTNGTRVGTARVTESRLQAGDTLYLGPKVEYEGIPCFSPEIFAWLRNPNPSAFKSFRKGVNELREEGAVQILYDTDQSKRDPILAAVGQLQLEVVQYRLENEYGVQTRIEPLGFSVARWVVGGWPALEQVGRIFNCKTVRDAWDRPVLLFKNEWNLNQLGEDHPDLELSAVAPVVSGVEPIAL